MKNPFAGGILAAFLIFSASAHGYDLGGPCAEGPIDYKNDPIIEAGAALQNKDWAKAIGLQKIVVRNACRNSYRWYTLAEMTLLSGDEAGAAEVVAEMQERGLDVRPAEDTHPFLLRFLESDAFKDTPAGRRIEEKRSECRVRQAVFDQRLSRMDPSLRPPDRYVAQGACPFECCAYRQWTVREDAPLVDSPFGHQPAGTAKKGTKVKGVTGRVYLTPRPVAVIVDHAPFARGDIIFQLDYLGEGVYRYWRSGRVGDGDITGASSCCQNPGEDCWAEFIGETKDDSVWWVQVQLPDGKKGWTDQARRFGNIDACGGEE